MVYCSVRVRVIPIFCFSRGSHHACCVPSQVESFACSRVLTALFSLVVHCSVEYNWIYHKRQQRCLIISFLGFRAWYNKQPKYVKILMIAGPILVFIFIFILAVCCCSWCKRRAPARLQVNLPSHRPQISSTKSRVPMQRLVNEAWDCRLWLTVRPFYGVDILEMLFL